MKFRFFAAAMIAAALLFTLTACGKMQSPAAADNPDSTVRETDQQNDAESSGSGDATVAGNKSSGTESAPDGGNESSASESESAPDGEDESSGTESAPDGEEAAPDEEPWKTALADSLFEEYGVLPEYYEDLGDGIYQVYVEVGGAIVPFVTVDSATGDYHG